MHPHLKNRFLAAQIAAHKLGFRLSVRSGWRSWQTQSRLYQNALTKYKSVRVANRWVLPPEKSMHVWGVAIDIHFGSPAARNWFRWNSSHFGLCRTYQNEWWHFEPVISPGQKCPAMQPFAK
jgi:LAS superfamily LD-carboxypeptidase LdcB